MSNHTHGVVLDILNELQVSAKDVMPGRIEISCASHDTAQSALESFAGFGGQGWLCTAESSAIEVFASTDAIRPKGAWPRWGELVNGEKSLHLRHDGNLWVLAELWQVDDPEGILVETKFIGKGGRMLHYQVTHSPEDVQGLRQYRPQLHRFLGFNNGERS